MPYVITTGASWGKNLGARDKYAVTSRRAVATLADARAAANDAIYRGEGESDHAHHWQPFYVDADALPEHGGRVGPLPDGTVIEVEPLDWRALRKWEHLPVADAIDAYNAAQEA
jgi:hypothetical protein